MEGDGGGMCFEEESDSEGKQSDGVSKSDCEVGVIVKESGVMMRVRVILNESRVMGRVRVIVKESGIMGRVKVTEK